MSTPERATVDNLRDNDLETVGWRPLRFNTPQVREQLETYTLPKIAENMERLGGVDEGGVVPRHIDRSALDGTRQLVLFDEL